MADLGRPGYRNSRLRSSWVGPNLDPLEGTSLALSFLGGLLLVPGDLTLGESFLRNVFLGLGVNQVLQLVLS